jgi:uncharacterized spore protein YtfJ
VKELKVERITEIKVGDTITVGDRKLIPIVRLQHLAVIGSSHPYCYEKVDPLAVIVVDSTGEYLLSLSRDMPTLQEALKKVPDLDSRLANL